MALSANATASRVVALAIAAQFSAAAPASLHKKAGNWIWKSRVSPDSNVERVLVTGGEPFYYSRQYLVLLRGLYFLHYRFRCLEDFLFQFLSLIYHSMTIVSVGDSSPM